ncbi:hypothetical protein [Bacillus sp. JJ722]|uniref:hypothetical protein n=1 Tax=Bacillus sp. JJ722 TaxID=3122973 RepID=UPI0030001923
MDLIVRNVDPVAVKKIDELAKKNNQSRQEFLKNQLELLAFYRQQTEREMHLQNLIEKNIFTMTNCYKELEKMNDLMAVIMDE